MVEVLVHHAEQGTIRLLYDKTTSADPTNPTTTNYKTTNNNNNQPQILKQSHTAAT